MVAQFLRLKLTLLGNTVRRRPLQLTGMLLGLLYGLGIAALLVVGLVVLRSTTPEVARAVTIVIGSLVVLGFLVFPLVFGVDDAIDPRRFSLFGIPTGKLAFSLAVTALVSVPSLIITIFSLAQIVTWSRGALPVLFAILAAVIVVPTCVLAARVASAVAASFLSTRRARDVTGVLLVLLLAIAAPAIALLATIDWQSEGLPAVRRIAAVVSWTPLGAPWSAPGDAELGRPDLAVIKLVIALAFLALLWFAWRALVGMMLVKPEHQVHTKNYLGLGWFERFPATPRGVIAARSLSYWGRDARYRVSLAVIPIVPIVMVAALLVAGVPHEIIVWVPVPVMCLFLGWSVHNDLAYDSSAFWLHVSASTRGTDDRWGRLAPALFLGVPLVILGSLVSALIAGDIAMLPGLVGLSACVLLVGLGISSVISAGFPYPAVHPGDSPFAQPQAVGTGGSVVQTLSFFATIVLTAPVVLLIVFAATGSMLWQYAALAAGLIIGLAALFGGVRWGGTLVTRRAPELLAFTLRN